MSTLFQGTFQIIHSAVLRIVASHHYIRARRIVIELLVEGRDFGVDWGIEYVSFFNFILLPPMSPSALERLRGLTNGFWVALSNGNILNMMDAAVSIAWVMVEVFIVDFIICLLAMVVRFFSFFFFARSTNRR
jgi:hypothetical protein